MQKASLYSPSCIKVEVPGTYITLKRYILDTLVVRYAVNAGAVFACGKVDQIVVEADQSVSFTIKRNGGKHKARIAIVATGASLGLMKKTREFVAKPPTSFALRCYVQSSLDLDHMVVSVDKDIAPGYAWIFPMGNHEYNIGCGIIHKYVANPPINLKKVYHNFVNEFPLARKLMQSGANTRPLRGAVLRADFEGVYPYHIGPIVVTGETIGTTLPFMGEGIGKAMESGELAAEIVHTALVSGDIEKLRAYDERLSNEFKPRYRAYQIAQDWTAKPWLADFLFRRAQKSKYLTDVFSGIIAETHTPRNIFSIKGIINSYWK
jgi:flavin-dependent dehydrogenase